ncbi:hypothetical protein J2Z48_002792 [Croceifilum oryzae]|uniref:Uncharacterized protein n=1 Tax=Croceifilum oryzae TaxID=1553429 RepID=A0AAJ1THJ4_9BACL|nr:hypothetical protein [Croceifilum oryzae]MDQ0418589.1 hypothetical protein [Croceifilum oryzae]
MVLKNTDVVSVVIGTQEKLRTPTSTQYFVHQVVELATLEGKQIKMMIEKGVAFGKSL